MRNAQALDFIYIVIDYIVHLQLLRSQKYENELTFILLTINYYL
jgi:hypothetical protein